MKKIFDHCFYRIMDANYNRAKEGLRVCEDILRFWENNFPLTRGYKDLRHRLTGIMMSFSLVRLLEARDVKGDVGKKSSSGELRRAHVDDIFFANSQRVKESIRVLEEFAKMKESRAAEELKRLRYRMYDLEKRIVTRSSKRKISGMVNR